MLRASWWNSNQFNGMTDEVFTYDDFEYYRKRLIKEISSCLSAKDKLFLLGIKNLEPDWSIYNFEQYPSIRWKLENLNKLKTQNREKHTEQYNNLRNVLFNSISQAEVSAPPHDRRLVSICIDIAPHKQTKLTTLTPGINPSNPA